MSLSKKFKQTFTLITILITFIFVLLLIIFLINNFSAFKKSKEILTFVASFTIGGIAIPPLIKKIIDKYIFSPDAKYVLLHGVVWVFNIVIILVFIYSLPIHYVKIITIDQSTGFILKDINAEIQISQRDSLYTFSMKNTGTEYSSGRILSYGTNYTLIVSGEGYSSKQIRSKLTNGIPVLNLFRGFKQDTVKLKPIPEDSVEVILNVENPTSDVKIFIEKPFEKNIDGRIARILVPKDEIVKIKITANNYENITDEFLASKNLDKFYKLKLKIFKREVLFIVKNMGGGYLRKCTNPNRWNW